MNLAMSFIRKLSLKKKIRAITFICIALLASVSFLIIFLISSAYKKVLYQSAASTLSYSSRELEFSLTNIDTMADMIMGDAAIQKNLSLLASTNAAELRATAIRGLYTSLNEYYFNSGVLKSTTLLTPQKPLWLLVFLCQYFEFST